MEDREIVELYWQRSEDAVPETEKKYGAYCMSIARNICGSREDAEECVNDTYLRAWNLMPDKRPERLSVFLGGIVRNLSIDRYRSLRRKKRMGETEEISAEIAQCLPAPEDVQREAEERELKRIMRDFCRGLRPEEQRVFVCRYYYFAPIKEISEKTGFSVSKVKSMLFRSRKKLRERLRREGVC